MPGAAAVVLLGDTSGEVVARLAIKGGVWQGELDPAVAVAHSTVQVASLASARAAAYDLLLEYAIGRGMPK